MRTIGLKVGRGMVEDWSKEFERNGRKSRFDVNLKNTTKNQHYLPQVEQRLNAANPNAAPDRQKIYSFRVLDHEKRTLQLERPDGVLISKNLALFDLFSFDVAADKKWRMNLESLFGQIETETHATTMRLLDRLDREGAVWEGNITDIQGGELYEDLVALFRIKLLNFARNPHSIHKVLNTLGLLAGFTPTSPQNQAAFERILNGRKPQQQWLCGQLGITDQDYVAWLSMLFMLFVECDNHGTTILDGIAKGMFEADRYVVAAMVCTYAEPVCLLTDRGFSTNIRKAGVDGFDFNVTSRAFVRYTFGHVAALVPQASPLQVSRFQQAPQSLQFHFRKNDLSMLGSFNANAIQQSAERVFSAIKEPVIPSPAVSS